MYILLATSEVWKIELKADAAGFIRALTELVLPTDTLVFGAYDCKKTIGEALKGMGEGLETLEQIPFSDNFSINRDEYPNGRHYMVRPTPTNLLNISRMSEEKNGGGNRDIFFDHVLAYREGRPLLPLFCFHDAFSGGEMYASGHYSDVCISDFTRLLKVKCSRIENPELQS